MVKSLIHKKKFIVEVEVDDKTIENYNKICMVDFDNKDINIYEMLKYLEFLVERPKNLERYYAETFGDMKLKFKEIEKQV
jgi:hypothetical protein